MKKYLVVFLILFFSHTFSAQAFSFEAVANSIVRRVSDLVQYIVVQKKYLFNNFSDPNTYPEWSKIEDFTLPPASTTSGRVVTGAPIVVDEPKIPEVKEPTPTTQTITGQSSAPTEILIAEIKTVDQPVSTSGILQYTNQERTSRSLTALVGNAKLDKIAKLRLDDLFARQYFEHKSPDGQSVADIAKIQDYNFLLIGENLALGNFGGDRGVVSAWMDSPGHRANILNSKYRELGVAQRVGNFKGDQVTIAVQIFGQPASYCSKPNATTKYLIESSTDSIQKMQTQAKLMYDNLQSVKNNPALDQSYYNQKVQEYNYFAKNINNAIAALKIMVDNYNSQVNQYNACIS